MYYLLLIVTFWLNSIPNSSISIAEGHVDKVPTAWTSLEKVEEVAIGKSYWAKVNFKGYKGDKITLQGGNWYMQNIQFYNVQAQLIHVGNHLSFEADDDQTFYLFYPFHDEKESDFFKITLSKTEGFLARKYAKNIFQSAFNSILIFVLLVCCFFIMGSMNRIYSNYILYILSILVFFSYQYGLLGELLPMVNQIPPTWMWILSASISFTYVHFSRSFLDMKTKDPLNYKVTTYGLYFILAIVLTESLARIFDYDILHQVWYKTLILTIEFGLMVVFITRIAMMRTIISNIFLIGAFILLLSSLTGQIASTFKIAYETNFFVQIGLVLDVFILSIGIATRVNIIQKERRDAQQKLIEQLTLNESLQQEYLKKLEKEVAERTSDLAKQNTENETLLKEVHHRVKNNLQMITSLLNMQQRRLSENAAKHALNLTKNRVKSISLIHEHLYKHDDFSTINLADYVEELTFMLIESLYRGPKKIKTDTQATNLQVDIETAIPIGLILNELITNSIKYAFQEHDDPQLSISVALINDFLELNVVDNGNGLQEEKKTTGFGSTIINSLIENSEGALEYPQTATGLHVKVRLKAFKVIQAPDEVAALD